MRTILIVNPKGGCGKSTIATNLASYYAVWGVETALVDFDPQRSSLEWLEQRAGRSPQYPRIHGLSGLSGRLNYPEGVRRVIYDAPARTDTRKTIDLIRRTDVVIIPILPSAIDIRAAAHFLGELMVRGKIRQTGKRVGVIANRVRENTIVYQKLQQFMGGLKIPFITHLRDSQNYVRAAERGCGVFEMGPVSVEKDLEQWRPLINWIEGKKKR